MSQVVEGDAGDGGIEAEMEGDAGRDDNLEEEIARLEEENKKLRARYMPADGE